MAIIREWAGGAARICCALRIFVRPLIIEPFLHRSSVWHSPELETTLVFPNSYTVFHSQIVIPRELRITAFQVLVEMDDTHKYFQQVSVKKKHSLCNSIDMKYKTSRMWTHLRNHDSACPRETEGARSIIRILGMSASILFLDMGAGLHGCAHCVDSSSAVQEGECFSAWGPHVYKDLVTKSERRWSIRFKPKTVPFLNPTLQNCPMQFYHGMTR